MSCVQSTCSYEDGGVLRVLVTLRLGHLLRGFPEASSSPAVIPARSSTKHETEERGRWINNAEKYQQVVIVSDIMVRASEKSWEKRVVLDHFHTVIQLRRA